MNQPRTRVISEFHGFEKTGMRWVLHYTLGGIPVHQLGQAPNRLGVP